MGRRERMVRIVGAVLAMGCTLLAGLPLQAQTVLFGPTQYTRTAGPPNQFTDTVTLPAGTTAPYTLHVVNGNANGTNRISSATVKLNGIQILGPSDFGQNVAVLDRTVALQASNTLEIRLTSAPGSFIVVSVLDTGVGAQPTALTPNPLNLTVGATAGLTATLAPAPTAAGSVTVTSSNATVATVPASVTFTAGQTNLLIPVTGIASGSTTVTVSLNGVSVASQVDVALPAPTVTGFTPTSGQPGTSVTVTGTNFVNVQTVTFHGVLAPTFTVTNATTLVAVVPPTATTGPIAIMTPAGAGTSAASFTAIPAPTVASLQPATRSIVRGTTGTVTVTLSAAQTTATSVALSSSNTTVATVPGTVTVPANQLSAPVAVTALVQGQADITASLNGANATSTITVVNPVPSLATLSPASLPSGSPTQTLTVTGQSFVSGATVHFGATALVTTFVSATQLTATIPAAQLTTKGTVPVTVENPAPGGGASNSLPFTIINGAPVLAPIGNKTIPLGSTLTFTATATDPDNDPISFAVTPLPLPAHAIFHSQTGLFLFTPDATQVGTVPLTFSVHDGILTTSEAITITVTGAPPGGVTSLTGRVDDTSQHPLDNLAVSLKGTTLTTTTAADGTFTLTSATLPTGRQQLVVTGLPQNFANLVVPVDIIPSVSNQLPQPLTLPPIDMATAVTVNPAAMTILTSPTLNVTVTIPPHTAKNPDGTDYTGPLTISPVPEYGRPESRPIELKPGLSVTIQPAGLLMDPPAPITFPNQDNLPPNTEFHLWSLSPDTGAFNAVGLLKVSADGLRLETVSGGVRQTAWHFPLAAAPRGAAGAEERGPCTECGMASTGDLREGNLIQRVVVPGVRTLGVSRDLTFHYQSTSADARPILPMNMLQSARASIPNTFSGRAVLGGVQQGPDRYWNATTLTPGVDNTFRIGLQLDSADLPTGLYPYELMVFSNYTQSSIGGGARGFTLLRNEQANPFGAGWTLEGLDRLYPQSDGRLLLAEGAGGTKLFGQSGRPIVIESFNVARSATISGVTTSFVGGPMFSEAKTDLLTPANFGATGTVSRPVTFRTGLQTLTAAALTGVDIFVLNQPATILSASEVQALEQFVAEGGAVFELSNLGATRPVLFGTFAGSNLVDPTADFTLAGLTSPLATGAFGTVTASLVTGPNSAYAVAGLATVIATNNSGPNVLLLAPDAGFSGLGRAVLIGDDEVFATGHPNVNNYTVGSNKAVFLNTIAFLAQSPGFGIPAPAAGQTAAYRGPANDFSTISKNAAGTYTRRLKDGTTYQFTAQGLQSARADRNGNTTAYVYNGSNQLMTITDPAGQVTTLNYNGTHLAIITDPAGRVTTVIHNGTGQLTGVTYADSSHLSFAYDPQHRMTQRTDARGQVSQYQYDHTGRFTQAILPTGQTRRLTPSEQSAVPNLAAGQGTVSNPATLSLGTVNRASFTDAKHQTTTFETDAFGGVTKQIDALTRTMTITRNAQGQPTTITRPNGAVTTMTYDSRGNLFLSTEQAIAATTGFLYDPLFNQVTLLVDPKNNQTALTYDAHGNPLTITDADNKVTIFTYDSRGLLLTSNDALNQTTTFTYDTQGRLLTTTDPLTRTTTLTYDAAGNVATSTDALNRVTTFQYDQKNRLKQVTDPATGVTQYTYDGNGNLLTVKDAKNQTTTFTYDDQNRLTSTTDPLGKVESYTYDGNDNLLTRVTPKADTISFAYNAANELITKTLPGILLTQYGYDTGGNLTSVTDPDSALAMTYDQANRLLTTSTTGSSNQPSVTLTYTYDKNGNRVERLDPVSRVGYGADKLNRLTFGTTPPGAGPFPANLLAAYPADGTANDPINNQHGTLQGGTTFTSGLVSQAFAFDGLDDFVTVPDSLLLDTLTTAATVEAWIKPELLPPPHATYDLFARRTEGGPPALWSC